MSKMVTVTADSSLIRLLSGNQRTARKQCHIRYSEKYQKLLHMSLVDQQFVREVSRTTAKLLGKRRKVEKV